jgi:hypothetical protein
MNYPVGSISRSSPFPGGAPEWRRQGDPAGTGRNPRPGEAARRSGPPGAGVGGAAGRVFPGFGDCALAMPPYSAGAGTMGQPARLVGVDDGRRYASLVAERPDNCR